VHISKTPIARHQIVAQHVSSKKQISTKTATLMQEVITKHEKFEVQTAKNIVSGPLVQPQRAISR